MRLLSVLGASQALGEHLRRHPEQWHELTDPTIGSTRPPAYVMREGLLRAVGADPGDEQPVATLEYRAAEDALRVEYRRLLLRLASRDLTHHLGRRRRGRGARRPRGRDPRRGPGRGPGEGRRGRASAVAWP